MKKVFVIQEVYKSSILALETFERYSSRWQ